MLDLTFDIENRDVIITSSDFETTAHPDAQNGGIILEAKAFNLRNPILGIGIKRNMGGSAATFTFDLNRWKQQTKSDGALNPSWSLTPVSGGSNLLINSNYGS